VARRTGLSASTFSQLVRGKIKSWDLYVERLTAVISAGKRSV